MPTFGIPTFLTPPVRAGAHVARLAATAALILAGRSAAAQDRHWTAVGAIGSTAMSMDTASIERDGVLRRVWLRSVDRVPVSFVAGRDTLEFDTVEAQHVFDCRAGTDAVLAARYYLGEHPVLPPRPADSEPVRLRPRSFLEAVARDLCGALAGSR